MAKLQQVKINGVILSNDFIIYRHVEETFNETTNTFEMQLLPGAKVELGFELQNYMTMEIWEGDITSTDKQIMDGYINEISDKPDKITLRGGDQLIKMTFEQINKVYIAATDATAGIVSNIIKDLLDTCAISYDASTIQDTTGMEGGYVSEFVCKDADPLERAMALADNVGFMLYYRSDTKKAYFHDKAYLTNPYTIFIGGVNNNVTNIPEWIFDGKDMFNFLKIEGALDIYQQPDQAFSGTGSLYDFTLTGKNATFVKASVGGVVKTGGKTGSSATYDYTFNKETNTITFITAPGAGASNVVITPFVGEPTPVEIDDAASIAKYGVTIKKKLTFSDVTNVVDAESKGLKILNAFKEEFTSTIVYILPSIISSLGIATGQTINVSDAYNTKIGDRTSFIRRVKNFYPEKPLEVELGDRDWKVLDSGYDTLIRLKRLEEQQAGNQDVLTIIKRPVLNITPTIESMDLTADYICDSPHTNHPINGHTNHGRILDSFETTPLTNWTSTDFTLADNTTNPVHLLHMLKATWSNPGTRGITSTQNFGNLSTYTGVNSGVPSKGCIGIWLQVNNATDINSVTLRIGSSATDYKDYTAKTASSSVNYDDTTFTLVNGNNYLIFRLDTPSSTQGSIDWTAIDYTRILLDIATGAGNASIDLLSISDSNYVGACPSVSVASKRTINHVTISF